MEFLIAGGILAGLGAVIIALVAIFRNIVKSNHPGTKNPKDPE